MANIIIVLLPSLKIALIFSVLAILFEKLLRINGLARGSNAIVLTIMALMLSILGQFSDNYGSVFLDGLFVIIAGPLALNRADLTMTIRNGRWWWKSEHQK